MRKVVMVLAALVLVAGGCNGGGTPEDPGDTGDVGGGTTEPEDATPVAVQIDGQAENYNSSLFAYFPDEVTAHPGDTIVYESVFTGEPHSITFGTAVQDAIEAFQALPPEALEEEGPPPPELMAAFERIPAMLPEGPGDANQTSVNPCFVPAGEEIPADPASPCPVTEPEPFTGAETFYNSGFLADGERFEMQLAEDLEPGTYTGFCTLHFTEMISSITVVPEDQDVPTADEVAEQGQEQLEAMAASLVPALEAAQTEVPEGEVLAGVTDEEIQGVLANEFVPAQLEVSAGDPVTWNVSGPHTVSFNAPESARVLLARGDDGFYHLSEEAIMPAGFEAPPPPEGEPEGPPPPVDAGTWDGTGFLSSGIMFGGPFIIAISEPGTYPYVCLIHPGMEGSITVN